MTDYVLGIDAGGTKTRAAAFSMPYRAEENPKPIAEALTGCGNAALDPEAAAEAITSAASDVIRQMQARGFGNCLKILCGAAGISSSIDGMTGADFLREKLLPLCDNVEVISDAVQSLIANFGANGDGLLIISGSGSIVLLRNNGKLTRSGGWGHLLGDGGSGYHIAVTALRLLVRQHDEGQSSPVLEKALFRSLGISDYSDLLSIVYRSPKSAIAALAPTVEMLADYGIPSAISAIRASANELAEDALRLLRRTDFNNRMKPFPTVLTGGCFEHLSLLRQCFVEIVTASSPVPLTVHKRSADPATAVLQDPLYQL